eukprot:CAMPEP_0118915684 /NCGR_PEP_ID=MMETSP1166-20130328/15812_1 /TAXON_ID=1104430 /ORGANISM="Chrysoreinhardia sp, Strain CCMP3193" /LENGTH=58 /DNA_ID=CAMNT_0006855413 /DNA_START=129 /DNA_END=302 /DNA_ORIENTATION=+
MVSQSVGRSALLDEGGVQVAGFEDGVAGFEDAVEVWSSDGVGAGRVAVVDVVDVVVVV